MVNKRVFSDFARSFRSDRMRHNAGNFCDGFHELLKVITSMNEEIESLKSQLKVKKDDMDIS